VAIERHFKVVILKVKVPQGLSADQSSIAGKESESGGEDVDVDSCVEPYSYSRLPRLGHAGYASESS
jgi:hypothetical protein